MSHKVFNRYWINGVIAFLLMTIGNSSAAVEPVELAKLLGSVGNFSGFGSAVAIDGDTALVGAWMDNYAGRGAGAAYIFVRNGTNGTTCPDEWCKQVKLTASDAIPYAAFGWSVALQGDTALVGAYDKLAPNIGYEGTGAVYVFTRSGTSWSESQKLTASDGTNGGRFGYSVALAGDSALVGATGVDNRAGAVYYFTQVSGAWSEQLKIKPSDPVNLAQFGYSLDLDGDTLVVGAPQDFGAGPNPFLPGAAYVFVRDGTHSTSCGAPWCEQFKLTASDPITSHWFGGKVAIDGDTAMVSAIFDHDAASYAGATYAFERSAGVWTQQQKLVANDAVAEQRFGWDLSLGDDIALIGAFYDDDLGYQSGSVYVFSKSNGAWSQETKITASDGETGSYSGDIFGNAIARDGNGVLIGARGDDNGNGWDAGSVYYFALDRTIQVQVDIKPGDELNCFNINGHGVIPVAILGSEDFDVSNIDLTTLLFSGLEVRVRGNKEPQCSIEATNLDPYPDLVCHFIDDPNSWTIGNSESATVTGALLDGTPFEGSDSICVVP
jgi:hypothetical protein